MEFKNIDLRDKNMPPIFNQGNNRSCTANACVASVWYQINRMKSFIGSRLNEEYSRMFTYYMTRWLGNNREDNTGGNLEKTCISLLRFGMLEQRNYDENKLDEPSFYALATAHSNRINAYYSIYKTKEDILEELYKYIPVVISVDMDKMNDFDNNGLSRKCLDWKSKNSECKTYHAMCIVGYSKDFNYYGVKRDVFIIRNSWEKSFGKDGYCYVPCDQLTKYNLIECYSLVKDKIDNDAPNYNYKKIVY